MGIRMVANAEEQETVIRIGRRESEASIWTSDGTMITRIDKLTEKPESGFAKTDERFSENGECYSKSYTCPKNRISFRSKDKARSIDNSESEEDAWIPSEDC